jgi:hypothetical protein
MKTNSTAVRADYAFEASAMLRQILSVRCILAPILQILFVLTPSPDEDDRDVRLRKKNVDQQLVVLCEGDCGQLLFVYHDR